MKSANTTRNCWSKKAHINTQDTKGKNRSTKDALNYDPIKSVNNDAEVEVDGLDMSYLSKDTCEVAGVWVDQD